MSDDNDLILPAVGRGRGRGSGVPLLPAGMWESFNESENSISKDMDIKNYEDDQDHNFDNEKNSNKEYDNESFTSRPLEFGSTRNRAKASSRDFGGRGRGRGLARDVKGVDWNCLKCENLNWSWRSHCNKCNTAKPKPILSAHEARDGIGGGFMERQDRASKASLEVDDEGFDDFGRRAKKSLIDKKAKEEAALRRLKQNYGFLLNENDLETENNNENDEINGKFDDSVDTDNNANHVSKNNEKDDLEENRRVDNSRENRKKDNKDSRKDSRNEVSRNDGNDKRRNEDYNSEIRKRDRKEDDTRRDDRRREVSVDRKKEDSRKISDRREGIRRDDTRRDDGVRDDSKRRRDDDRMEDHRKKRKESPDGADKRDIQEHNSRRDKSDIKYDRSVEPRRDDRKDDRRDDKYHDVRSDRREDKRDKVRYSKDSRERERR